EGSGALVLGARYGQGTMYTRNAGEHAVFWQGPSVGLDFGGDGSKVMMLVYNLPTVDAIYGRYPGVAGSAYVVGGLGLTVLKKDHVVVVPIRSGVGARLGINAGYLHFSPEATWNPF
ncbi:MAG TPA: EipA family protein, partial [Devosia sp.]|nr:EipA family protein [Devosia sp.]